MLFPQPYLAFCQWKAKGNDLSHSINIISSNPYLLTTGHESNWYKFTLLIWDYCHTFSGNTMNLLSAICKLLSHSTFFSPFYNFCVEWFNLLWLPMLDWHPSVRFILLVHNLGENPSMPTIYQPNTLMNFFNTSTNNSTWHFKRSLAIITSNVFLDPRKTYLRWGSSFF